MARELELLGVKRILVYGSMSVGGLRVLGKGWASVVVLVEAGKAGVVAAKMLHPRSRRLSLLREAAFLTATSWASISPQLYGFARRVILYEYINGVSLESYSPTSTDEKSLILRRLLWKARRLDRLGISHNELARPHRQVLVRGETCEPYIIDFESATTHEKPSNLTQLIGGLARMKQFSELAELIPQLKQHLNAYKRGVDDRGLLYSKILGIILSRLQQ